MKSKIKHMVWKPNGASARRCLFIVILALVFCKRQFLMCRIVANYWNQRQVLYIVGNSTNTDHNTKQNIDYYENKLHVWLQTETMVTKYKD